MYWLQLATMLLGFSCIAWKLRKMARQEDIDAVVAKLTTVGEQVGGIDDDMKLLKAKIDELQNNTPPEVNLAELQALADSLVERTSALNAETPANEPVAPVAPTKADTKED